ncbi:12452_t:CDS:1 [Ambispora gerdemannii]|uniref:12452_t:CDS:1 n=1 Tax=Ambispora gerdemannii TaxID=144530 RepID=A0A9N9FR58_9GLOM|nr:12452_t:CDS:1 [Ambispora gerdemannii]
MSKNLKLKFFKRKSAEEPSSPTRSSSTVSVLEHPEELHKEHEEATAPHPTTTTEEHEEATVPNPIITTEEHEEHEEATAPHPTAITEQHEEVTVSHPITHTEGHEEAIASHPTSTTEAHKHKKETAHPTTTTEEPEETTVLHPITTTEEYEEATAHPITITEEPIVAQAPSPVEKQVSVPTFPIPPTPTSRDESLEILENVTKEPEVRPLTPAQQKTSVTPGAAKEIPKAISAEQIPSITPGPIREIPEQIEVVDVPPSPIKESTPKETTISSRVSTPQSTSEEHFVTTPLKSTEEITRSTIESITKPEPHPHLAAYLQCPKDSEIPVAKERTVKAAAGPVSSVKDIWNQNWLLRFCTYILAAFSSIPICILGGWIIGTAVFVFGIAGIVMFIAEIISAGIAVIIFWPVICILTFLAFILVTTIAVGYFSYRLIAPLSHSTENVNGKHIKDNEAIKQRE